MFFVNQDYLYGKINIMQINTLCMVLLTGWIYPKLLLSVHSRMARTKV